MQRLRGHVAIVTGGTRGIGAHIVESYREEGCDVLFTGRDEERGREVADRTGGFFLKIDSTEQGFDEAIVYAALQKFGHIDVLVNNAGGPGQSGGVMRPAAMQESIDQHLKAPWVLSARVVPEMTRVGGGSIINICSVAGQRAGAASLAYSVSKAALLHWTRCAAAELGRSKIRVNSISPGFINTPIHATAVGFSGAKAERIISEIGKFFATHQSLPMVGQPADISGTAVLLASAEAAFITGSDFVIDGGLMWGPAKIF